MIDCSNPPPPGATLIFRNREVTLIAYTDDGALIQPLHDKRAPPLSVRLHELQETNKPK